MEFAFLSDITHYGSAFPNAEESGSIPVILTKETDKPLTGNPFVANQDYDS